MTTNDTLAAMKARRSCRAFVAGRMPDDDQLAAVAEAGTYAATGRGMQSPLIVVVKDQKTRDRLSELNAAVLGTSSDPFYGAPVVMVVLADRERPTYLYDGSLVMGNLMLAAQSLGLASCWIHRAKEVFDSPEGKALLREWGIEGNYEGIGHCVVGFAAADPAPAKPRKSDYVRWI